MTTSSATLDSVLDLLRAQPHGEEQLELLAHEVRRLPVGELVYLVETRAETEAALLFRVLDKELALSVFEALPPQHQADLISALRTPQVADIIGELDPDDRALLLDELPASVTERLMHGLDADERAMTTAVLGYSRDAIGRYMSPEVLPLRPTMTTREALEHVRTHAEEPETIYMLPVVDRTRRLLGVIGLRRLLLSDGDEVVGDVAHEAVHALATDDREDVARRFFTAKLLAMPIVDSEQRLVGILTVDDAVEILEQENAEDSARTSGAEPLSRAYLSTTILGIVRSRIVWLLVLAISAILTVQVLEIFEDRLQQLSVLAVFIPLLTGTGGNTGNQAATTVTRALATGEVRLRDLPRVIWRELRVGLVLGSVLGTLGFVISGLVYGWPIGLVMGTTLLSVCTMAAIVGGLMPLVAKKVGADPAVFSNPFISTFCDATGLIIYFTIATAVLGL
ncbi:magnesium transporter [Brachybacterium sp. P6-10-X1]|uniref:magnesium transporter n=1 Tax=Brachybacterium sp. P6-10-X1 TaxID=1903186 RepID=UPI000971BA9C|nr:magnesium transporter [Brachybacterium sp. P6-10-X1]APX34912.1 magnesium transporter [Brachybacterium sp. P6-10-X1]